MPKDRLQDPTKRAQDRELDRELEATFPASDPPTITLVPYARRFVPEPSGEDEQA